MNTTKPSINYPSQFAFLLGLMGICIVLSALLIPILGGAMMHVPFMQVIKNMNKPEYANVSRLLNTMAALFSFFLPAFIVARIVSKRPFAQLGFSTALSARQVLLVILLTFASIMLSGALGELNEWIPLPATWHAKAKALEDTYKEAMMAMATMKTTADYLLALLVIAAAPAIFEEVLFRGGFQQIFTGWTKSRWAGIIITSILFSAIHFSYFGFLPRAALGIVLGLIFSYSKNIWLNILLHFLNNALVVTQLFVLSRQGKSIDKTIDEKVPMWWALAALALLFVLFWYFKKESDHVLIQKEQSIHASPENILS